jgi:drug/metabolite transporter (DMT)-like permease
LRIDWSPAQLGGAVAYAATVTLFVVATKWTTAANAILLQYTAPVYVAFLGRWFLGEKTRRVDWLTLIAVLGGMTLFFFGHLSLRGWWGNLAALGSGFSFAWLVLFLRRQKDASPLASIFLGNLLAAFVAIPALLHSAPATTFSWVGLLLLGVVQLGLPYVLYSTAIRYVTAMEALLIPTVEPVLNPVWVFLFVGERPTSTALIGGAVIIGAVLARGSAPLFDRRRSRLACDS